MKKVLVCVMFGLTLFSVADARAQYTDQQAIDDLGGPQEFAARRAELSKQVKHGIVVLFARNAEPEADHYREDNDFYYYTGLADLGAVLVMDVERGTSFLFEPEQSPRISQVYGFNALALPKAEQAKLGFTRVIPLGQLDEIAPYWISMLSEKTIWLRLNFPDKADLARMEEARANAESYKHPYYSGPPSDLQQARLLAERYPLAQQKDVTPYIDAMRNIKRPREIEVLRKVGKLSAEGDRAAIAQAYPGEHQYEIESDAFHYFYSHGAQGVAYPAIVGSGNDINTWHYFSNRHVIEANGLVVFDYAASLDHMTMDITRTFNISGKFTPEQAKWYAVDLEAQKATIEVLRPGHTYEEAAAAGQAVYKKYGIEDQWLGYPGHSLGLATHDTLMCKGPILAGHVVTVEPIIEFPEKHMHFRVEDTILVTEGAPEILSAAVPKEMSDVEKLVGSERSHN